MPLRDMPPKREIGNELQSQLSQNFIKVVRWIEIVEIIHQPKICPRSKSCQFPNTSSATSIEENIERIRGVSQ